jgi:hypothetical protein
MISPTTDAQYSCVGERSCPFTMIPFRNRRCVAGQKATAEMIALVTTPPISTLAGLPPAKFTNRTPKIAPTTEIPPSTNG